MRRMLGLTLLELLIVIAVASIILAVAVPSWKRNRGAASGSRSSLRLDYRQDRFEVWCDTATGTRLYWIANGGLASVPGGCK